MLMSDSLKILVDTALLFLPRIFKDQSLVKVILILLLDTVKMFEESIE